MNSRAFFRTSIEKRAGRSRDVVRRLTLEKLEPRAMLAADIGWQDASLGEQFEIVGEVPALSPDWGKPGLPAEMAESAMRLDILWPGNIQGMVEVGEIVRLQLVILGDQQLPDNLRIYIQFESTTLVPEGTFILREGDACLLEGDGFDETQCSLLDEPHSRDLLLEVSMRVVGPGATKVNVTVAALASSDGLEQQEILYNGAAQFEGILSNPSDGGGSGYTDPNSRPAPLLEHGSPAVRSGESGTDSSHILPTRSIVIRAPAVVDSTFNTSFNYSLPVKASSESDSESLVVKRIRVNRSAYEWSLEDDVSAAIFRPFASTESEGLQKVEPAPSIRAMFASSTKAPPPNISPSAAHIASRGSSGTQESAMRLLHGVTVTQLESAAPRKDVIALNAEQIDALLTQWMAVQADRNHREPDA